MCFCVSSFAQDEKAYIPPIKGCGFENLTLPQDFYVYAGGGYSGSKQYIQIDQSGHEATEMNTFISIEDKPIVLILSAYEPTVWQIKYTKKTKIIAVYLSGHHRQIITGLPKTTLLLQSDYVSYCKSSHIVSEDRLKNLNSVSQELFNKNVDMVYFAKNGEITIGNRQDGNDYISYNAKSTKSFHDKTKPLAGPMGIKEATKQGILRPATKEDYKPVYDYLRRNDPPVIGRNNTDTYMPYNAYVIEKKFVLPAGLYGAHSVNLLLKRGVSFPEGELGHSCLFDLNTNTSYGCGSDFR
jgi:hypothetical protein